MPLYFCGYGYVAALEDEGTGAIGVPEVTVSQTQAHQHVILTAMIPQWGNRATKMTARRLANDRAFRRLTCVRTGAFLDVDIMTPNMWWWWQVLVCTICISHSNMAEICVLPSVVCTEAACHVR